MLCYHIKVYYYCHHKQHAHALTIPPTSSRKTIYDRLWLKGTCALHVVIWGAAGPLTSTTSTIGLQLPCHRYSNHIIGSFVTIRVADTIIMCNHWSLSSWPCVCLMPSLITSILYHVKMDYYYYSSSSSSSSSYCHYQLARPLTIYPTTSH